MESRKSRRIVNGLNPCKQFPTHKQFEFAIFSCKQGVDSPGFEVKPIDDYIGSGVFLKKPFKKGDYLLEYQGDRLSFKEAKRREKEYEGDPQAGSFMYFFKYKEKTMCIDATNHIFSSGRMVNDAAHGSPEENATIKIVVVNGRPHLCIFALRDLVVGEEIRFDYGVTDLPWRIKPTKDNSRSNSGETDISTSTYCFQMNNEKYEGRESSSNEANIELGTCSQDADKESHIRVANKKGGSGESLSDGENKKMDTCITDTCVESQKKDGTKESSWNEENRELDTYSTFTDMECHKKTATQESSSNEDYMEFDTCSTDTDMESYYDSGSEYKPSENDDCVSNSNSEDSEVIVDQNQKVFFELNEHLKTVGRRNTEPKQTIPSNHTCITRRSENDRSVAKTNSDVKQFACETSVNIDHSEHAFEKPTFEKINVPEPTDSKSNKKIFVASTNNSDMQRSYDKKFFCLYCKKALSGQLPRHLKSQHAEEQEVVDYMQEKDKLQKLNRLAKLRNMGNYIHNCEVLRKGEGYLAVTYRPSEDDANYEDYGPCPYCFGTFVRSELWRHKINCPFSPGDCTTNKIAVDSKILLPSPSGTSELLHSVISGMRSDEICKIVKTDPTISAFGKKLCTRNGHDVEQHNHIRQKLREMGRLLKELRFRCKDPEKSLCDFIDPQYFRLIIDSSKALSLYDNTTNRYGTPSLALKIGQSLQKCAKILISQGIELQDNDRQEKAEEFMKLVELNWTDEISTNAHKTLYEGKRNNSSKILPLADDVKLLADYLREAAVKHHDALLSSKDLDCSRGEFGALSEVLLAQIILFNRRRAGEVSKMTVALYQMKKKTTIDGGIGETLTELEKRLCHSLYRVEIPGKRGRTVPVLFSTDITKYIDVLISARSSLLTNTTNPYLFPRVYYNANGHIRGTDSLLKYAQLCGAKEKDRLTSTKLRKHIATMSQIINLKDNELDILANFLGHDIRVHREFYRLPEETVQVAKVSKLLMQMESGGKGLQPGQTLESIKLDETLLEELEESDMDVDNEESDQEIEFESEKRPSINQNANTATEGKSGEEVDVYIQPHTSNGKKRSWKENEKVAIQKHLGRFILMEKLPGKRIIDSCLAAEPVLQSRSWRNVKDFCRNAITSNKNKKMK